MNIFFRGVLGSACLGVLLLLSGCELSAKPENVVPAKSLDRVVQSFTLAGVKSIGQAPYVIADSLGYFSEVGLSPTITWMGGGDQVFKALTSKSVDMGLVGLVPFGFVAEKFPSIKLVSVITDLNDTKLVVRRDRISSLQDLKGKKLGYSKSTASDILFEKLLEKQGYIADDVVGINLAPPALQGALAQGDIDGYFAREPNIQNAKKILSGNLLIFDQSADKYERYFSLFGDESYLDMHQDIAKIFLNALNKASIYISTHPDESQKILAEFLGMDKQVLQSIWADYVFKVDISEKHRLALQDIFERTSRVTNTPSLASKSVESALYLLK